MALIDYSDSEGSDQEAAAKDLPGRPKPKVTHNKPATQKLVDSLNPHKIRVHLNQSIEADTKAATGDPGPPAKRARVGGGGLSDFNSLLPAPKRTAARNGSGRGGLERGVNLKTGATPGFTREPFPPQESIQNHNEDATNPVEPSPSETRGEADRVKTVMQDTTTLETTAVQPPKKATMFKPLSVARKPQKKKPPLAQPAKTGGPSEDKAVPKSPMPRISLFSNDGLADGIGEVQSTTTKGSYQPMLYQTHAPDPVPPADAEPTYSEALGAAQDPPSNRSAPGQPQSLDAIAESLNLSASAKRQLLGRNASKYGASAITVTNFSIGAEYAANEELRKAGEAVQHNPVRAIAPGKHSLKQLVNVATMQKDALEESFAEGRRNKKEVGGRYGW
ncbi:MAG: hypothetical protein Q9163_000717 [Psora crenata]